MKKIIVFVLVFLTSAPVFADCIGTFNVGVGACDRGFADLMDVLNAGDIPDTIAALETASGGYTPGFGGQTASAVAASMTNSLAETMAGNLYGACLDNAGSGLCACLRTEGINYCQIPFMNLKKGVISLNSILLAI